MHCYRTLLHASRCALLFLAIWFIPSHAQADYNVTIGSGASSNGSWSGANPDVWTPSGSGATVSASEVQTRLNAGTPVVVSTAGGGAEAGDISVAGALAWTADSVLRFQAANDIKINAGITATGNGAGLVLGYGTGRDYSLGDGVKVTLSGNSPTLAIGVVGSETAYMVINSLGVAGDATTTTLQGMKNNVTGHYAMGRDIDASPTVAWNGGAGWEPVGGWKSLDQFSGQFHGLGHTINNLTISRGGGVADQSQVHIGLFGSVSGYLRDVGLIAPTVTGGSGVGALAGSLGDYIDNAGLIANCYVAGGVINAVTSTSNYGPQYGGVVGGLVGGSGVTCGKGLARIVNGYSSDTTVTSERGDAGGLTGGLYCGRPCKIHLPAHKGMNPRPKRSFLAA